MFGWLPPEELCDLLTAVVRQIAPAPSGVSWSRDTEQESAFWAHTPEPLPQAQEQALRLLFRAWCHALWPGHRGVVHLRFDGSGDRAALRRCVSWRRPLEGTLRALDKAAATGVLGAYGDAEDCLLCRHAGLSLQALCDDAGVPVVVPGGPVRDAWPAEEADCRACPLAGAAHGDFREEPCTEASMRHSRTYRQLKLAATPDAVREAARARRELLLDILEQAGWPVGDVPPERS